MLTIHLFNTTTGEELDISEVVDVRSTTLRHFIKAKSLDDGWHRFDLEWKIGGITFDPPEFKSFDVRCQNCGEENIDNLSVFLTTDPWVECRSCERQTDVERITREEA